ncbi:MGMT family protein [Agilicoccus flavus]|uniref:MGMT family protein n=1 Tax=Agilicoccus flavus TaxID=2775968 RepID=UPI0027D9FACB|nr:MGMT family protein [Agilicoccus flavus]
MARVPFDVARAQVAAVARLVPPGRLVSYGDIGALLELSPRAVGRAMATHEPAPGEPEVPWWRVTNAAGDLPPHLRDEAFARYRDEGTPIRASGTGAAIRTHRADLPAWADAAQDLLGPLPGANA